MTYRTRLLLLLTSVSSIEEDLAEKVCQVLAGHQEVLIRIVSQFMLSEVSPRQTCDFEQALADAVRSLGRDIVQWCYNNLEADQAEKMPHDVTCEAGGYRRLNKKTPNRQVATLFGNIELWRYGYRYWHRGEPEKTIFPLEDQLGLVRGATPALAEIAAREMADAGATQRSVLDRLKRCHDISWGAQRLRQVTDQISQEMEPFRQERQVLKVLELMQIAYESSGKCKPVLSVGRDGISLCKYHGSCFEVATTASVTVYDRRGRRLGSVYLAFTPQSGQGKMTEQLTSLIRAVLERWDGPLPRLAYVTDAGENETAYYRKVLRHMCHPRTGQPLTWLWIVDYFHVSERIWKLAEALFGKGHCKSHGWAMRMNRLLKKSNGPSRVLHSAAAMRRRVKMSKARAEEYRKAANYIRRRTKFMQYAEFKKKNLPIGSGVTEAACKTIFTQRLKLSGMRWTHQGAQRILNLRVILLSGVWQQTYRDSLDSHHRRRILTYDPKSIEQFQTAA